MGRSCFLCRKEERCSRQGLFLWSGGARRGGGPRFCTCSSLLDCNLQNHGGTKVNVKPGYVYLGKDSSKSVMGGWSGGVCLFLRSSVEGKPNSRHFIWTVPDSVGLGRRYKVCMQAAKYICPQPSGTQFCWKSIGSWITQVDSS